MGEKQQGRCGADASEWIGRCARCTGLYSCSEVLSMMRAYVILLRASAYLGLCVVCEACVVRYVQAALPKLHVASMACLALVHLAVPVYSRTVPCGASRFSFFL